MKNFLRLSLSLALFALISLPALGQVFWNNPTPAFSQVTVGATNNASALASVTIPAGSANNGTPTVTFISAGSDLAAARIQAYYIDAATVANFTNSTTSLPVTQTNGFGNSDAILIRHILNNTYEKRTTTTFTSSTNLTTTVAPMGAVLPGDIIYHMTTTAAPFINIGTGPGPITNTWSGVGLLSGQRGLPLYLELTGTSAACLYSVTANYNQQ